MAATKAEFYSWYAICPRGTLNGHDRRFTEIRLHYHPVVIEQQHYITRHADQVLNGVTNPIDANSKVIIFGSGFGWLCEELISRTGCTCIGVDTSQYIIDNLSLSPDDELEESIIAAGLDKMSGLGKDIFDQFTRPGPRSTADVRLLDLATKKDQNTLKKDFPDTTHVISEEVWQLLTDPERQEISSFFSTTYPNVEVRHIIDGVFM